ncbi:MAG: cobalt ECF transporter T component CbiQ [Acidimicrobiia bacterium]
MAGSHGQGVHGLYMHGHSVVHRLAPECKIAAALLTVFAIVATPRESWWAFAVHAVILLSIATVATIPLTALLKRLVFELPFVAFAFFLPFIGRGDRVQVWFLSLSHDGLWAAWNILAKGTLGVVVSVILASTTTMAELIRGLERLHIPQPIVLIAGFMVRYLDVITGQVQRMKVARLSRGYDPRWIWQAGAWAASAGTLFIRSYERGERVHLAMLSRGYTGTIPTMFEESTSASQWTTALSVPFLIVIVTTSAWIIR